MSQLSLEPTELLTTGRLVNHTWGAANILRGSIDSADFKHYILGFLFLKRICDRFLEEWQALDPEDREDPDRHQVFLPPDARWTADALPENSAATPISHLASGIGEELNKRCEMIEAANPSLEGVMHSIDFNDARKLGEGKARDNVLRRLVVHFSQIDLRNAALSDPDTLGRAYEILIEKFADDAGKKGGEFYTPPTVVDLMVALLDPQPGMSVSDPTCGSGGMLVHCAEHVAALQKASGKSASPIHITLHGQEKNRSTWAICKLNLLLHNLSDAHVTKGDTIRDPQLQHEGRLRLYDRVIANPPFSLSDWGFEEASHDPWRRFRYGVPPKGKGDLAFVQHMLATTAPSGVVGVVMPHGVLFRGSTEAKIRQRLLEGSEAEGLQGDLLEAVIGLPANLFYGTGIPAAILILHRDKPASRRKKVLFIDASREFSQDTKQNKLRLEDVRRICNAFMAFADEPGYARVVPLEEIASNEFNLNISRYVSSSEEVQAVDIQGSLRRLRELEAERNQAEQEMDRLLKELGYGG